MKNFKWPFLIDSTGKPSATMFFLYIAFFFALGSVANLLSEDPFYGALCSLGLFFGCYIFYRLKNLDKISLSREGIELEDTPDACDTEKKE